MLQLSSSFIFQLHSHHKLDKNLLPPKKLFGNQSEAFIKKRQLELQQYLQVVLHQLKSVPQVLAAFLDFHRYVSLKSSILTQYNIATGYIIYNYCKLKKSLKIADWYVLMTTCSGLSCHSSCWFVNLHLFQEIHGLTQCLAEELFHKGIDTSFMTWSIYSHVFSKCQVTTFC